MTAPSPAGAPRPANRLARQSSPYLLQHAHNPVDWRPWGDDAFAEARRRNVPLFLSIGYSTCYWCHVMERESFEDDATAAQMNERFVCVKVDREERPDIDDAFMTATTALTGHGGWPLSCFLTPPGAAGPDDPGLKPFYCATYFPPEPRHGLPSFTQILQAVSLAWRDKRADIIVQSDRLAAHIQSHTQANAPDALRPLVPAHVESAVAALLRAFDPTHGGFGSGSTDAQRAVRGPKFPQPAYLEFLLDALAAAADEQTRAAIDLALQTTLDRMAMGGMHDHLAGGFHRYSVDEKWLVPHFEKMLYDNALLLRVYARRAATTSDAFHRAVAERIVAFLTREMSPSDAGGGAFFSALDAEVDGREGLNYLWTPEQIDALFAGAPADAAFAQRVCGLDEGPNFRDPHHPHEPPSNVLFLPAHPARLAEREALNLSDFSARLARITRAMLEARALRPQPRLDDKIITSWNGLAIAALADAAQLLDRPEWLALARRAADFIWSTLRAPDGALLRSWRTGVPGPPAVLEDYAALALAFAALARAAPDDRAAWLDRAAQLLAAAHHRFFDPASRTWYDAQAGRSDLFVRARASHDGAIPSAQSLLLHAFLDLHALAAPPDRRWLDAAATLLAGLSHAIDESPVSTINSTRALLRMLRDAPDALRASDLAPHVMPAGAGPDASPTSAGASSSASPALEIESPVAVFASAERITITRSSPATLDLQLHIDHNWHILAHEPYAPDAPVEHRIPGLIGLLIRLTDAGGLRVDIQYPTGEPFVIPDPGAANFPPILVHSGDVHLRITLSRTDAPLGAKPLLLVTYQPCNDNACLKPVTVELDVAIDAT